MLIAADLHLHVYPFFDTGALLSSLAANLAANAGGRECAGIACLAERDDCRWFEDVKNGRVAPGGGYEVAAAGADGCSLALKGGDGRILHVVAGRQVATSERLEVLDVLRGFALFGILQVNFIDLIRPGELNDLQLLYFQGKFRTIYSFLFGLGFAIQLIRAEDKQRPFVARYLWRTLLLFLIGSAHFIFLRSSTILCDYAVMALALLFVRRCRLGLLAGPLLAHRGPSVCFCGREFRGVARAMARPGGAASPAARDPHGIIPALNLRHAPSACPRHRRPPRPGRSGRAARECSLPARAAGSHRRRR